MVTYLEMYSPFERAMRDARNLVQIHKDLNSGPGRRHRESALNRSVVVLTVAAWQSAMQSLAKALVEEMKPVREQYSNSLYYEGATNDWRLRRASVENAIDSYGTPNAENTRKLLRVAGYDPWVDWHWTGNSAEDVRRRMNEWLNVRHAIVHGDDELPKVSVLARTPKGTPTIWRKNADDCISLFDKAVRTTKGP